ncbi:MFS transporter [SAR202 cluster bacterium AC-409-J13_OGT_754m]|nr:MFS transporter [SAR202 cluster bacterium AC-409-J13_OGT_754m]
MKVFHKGSSKNNIADTNKTFYFHYAWVIVAIIAGMQMVGASVRMAFGVFIEPMSEGFGWSHGSITLSYAISHVISALASPWAGRFGDKHGARRAMFLGCGLFVVGMILTGMATELWQIYASFGILIGISEALFLVPLIPSAMIWFRRHLGWGMGVLMLGWGLGPAVSAPLMGFMIERLGWQWTFWVTAGVSSIIMAPMIYFFRNKPSDMGLLPYGAIKNDGPEIVANLDKDKVRVFTKYISKTSAYWNMSSIHFLGCVGHAVILVYLIPIALHEGISLVVAASLLTVMSGVSIVTRLATPVLADKHGPKLVMFCFYFIQGVTVLMLFGAHETYVFYLFAVSFGIGYGGETGGFPILNRKYYGYAPVGSAHGFQMLGAGLGMALGGWIGGVLFDIYGTYDIALAVSVLSSIAGALSILLLESTNKLLIPDWETSQA